MDSPREYFSDVEGPFSLDDNAFEIAGLLIPNGYKFFKQLSAYDDFLADIVKKEGYKPGDTLRLQAPFLKAFGATNEILEQFAADNINVIPGTNDTLQYLNRRMRCFLISTSYESYIQAFCKVVGFPFEQTVCTNFDIDKYNLKPNEINWLKELTTEIVSLPDIIIPSNAVASDELHPEVLKSIERLDQIFWDEMEKTDAFQLLEDIKPVGGSEKERAIIERTSDLSNVLYTGDSITDREAFRRIKKDGGLTISVNGNMYAVREAEIGCMIENSIVTAVFVSAFYNSGYEATMDLAYNWNSNGLKLAKKYGLVASTLIDSLLAMYPNRLPEVEVLTDSNREEFGQKSTEFRKQVRGENVGALG